MNSFELVHEKLKLTFTWQEDRFGQVIAVSSQNQWLACLRSLEGTSAEDWPASPAFQQATQEPMPDGRSQMFLVGMAGKSHWSMSVSPDSGGLVFDVACRVKEPPQRLGSHYEGATAGDFSNLLLCELVELPDHPATRSQTQQQLALLPQVQVELKLPATIRWKYRIAAR